jgi:ABC-type transport system substrate-binding protein/class 3 adenylate cyclase/streptogramin lyase
VTEETGGGQAAIRTFLIADVRGYTRFTQEHGDEAAAALAAGFAALVRRSVAQFDGTLVELRGDEALVAFSSAREALRAAVDLQRRAREETDEGQALPLGLGIGLDSGEAVPTEGGYRGGALNLAARLCSIAEPGQIYASEGVIHLARRVPGLRFGQPRTVRLKGIEHRVRAIPVEPEVPLPPLPVVKPPPRNRARLGAAAAAAGLVIIGAVLAFWLARGGEVSTAIAANAAGLVDGSNGSFIAEVPVAGRPSAVAASSEAVWVTDAVDDKVLRIDPDKHLVVDRIEVGRGPAAVVVGEESVWVANGQDGTVSEINPDKGTVVATRRVGNGPTGLAVTPGALWVVNELDATLSRISSATGRPVATVKLGHNPSGIAAGLGSVWVTSEESGLLLRVDPGANAVSQTVSVGNGPTGVTVGQGAVWVANPPDRTISRVDPATGSVTKIALDGAPGALAFVDGGLWSAYTLEGRLALVDPEGGRVRRTIDVGSIPAALAGAGDRLWVAALASRATHRGGTLRIVSEGGDAFDSIDPGVSFRSAAWQALSLVYDGLVTFRRVPGPLSATVVPDLAASLPTSQSNGTMYTFRLRRGIRYSNGREVKATDFRHAIERQFRAESGFAGTGLDVLGADRCSKDACDLSRGIVTDDRAGTVTFHLGSPDPDFLFKLALPFGAAVPAGSPSPDAGTRGLPATGPYMVERYAPDQTLVLARNPHFREWSAEAQPDGYPDRLVWTFGVAPERATTMVERGRADIMIDAPPERRLPEIARLFPSQAHPYVRAATFYLFLNTRLAPFDDVRVRKALNFAADRSAIVRQWGGSELARPTCQLLPPGFPGYGSYCPYTVRARSSGIWTAPDLSRARQLIQAANATGAAVTVAVNADDPTKVATARYFVRLLKRLGFQAQLRLYPDTQNFYEQAGRAASRVHAGIQGWESDFPRPSDFFLNLLTCSSYQPAGPVNLNPAGFCDPSVDRAAERAHELEASDPAAAGELWQQVDRRVVDSAPLVPFVNTAGIDLVSARTGNYQRSVQLGVLLDQLWVK